MGAYAGLIFNFVCAVVKPSGHDVVAELHCCARTYNSTVYSPARRAMPEPPLDEDSG
jgi:hypothetical protein